MGWGGLGSSDVVREPLHMAAASRLTTLRASVEPHDCHGNFCRRLVKSDVSFLFCEVEILPGRLFLHLSRPWDYPSDACYD